ncbi:MAG: hypothetical protein HC820_01620 [Hydrococcus sp. RM1_1_31]|nr:hypothetical protein [Hydrococcus sp. RM1_1_31]
MSVTSATAPGIADWGNPVEISWTVTNKGDVRAGLLTGMTEFICLATLF